MCTRHVSSALNDQKKVAGPLELEPQVVELGT